ncbi:glycosyltransferase family 2 protein [Aquihabitans daechungensis]|uniref:glycosyltransferase family 2 protein n=1 Tax=Aquihabitans daechungensis TaxID=1052257 RepID=UPI003B9ED058
MSLTVVVPVFNNAATVPELHSRLLDALRATQPDLEVVFVDDGSTDGSWEAIRQLAAAHPGTRGIRLRRNVGQQAAILCGVDDVTSDRVAILDADLEHPPEALPLLVAALDRGSDLAIARRVGRESTTIRRLAAASAQQAAWLLGMAAPDLGKPSSLRRSGWPQRSAPTSSEPTSAS